MNLALWLHQTAMTWPDRAAVYAGDTLCHSYGSLAQAAADRGAWLAQTCNIGPGDRVAIFAKNCPEYLEIVNAVWWIGAVVVPVNCKLHPNEALWIAENAGAKVVLTDKGDLWPNETRFAEYAVTAPYPTSNTRRAPAAVARHDIAWLFYTSGTTGKPKGVMLSHENLRQMTLTYMAEVDCPQTGDHMLYAAPMSHGAGLYLMAQIRAGGCHLIPPSRGFDSDEVIALAQSRGNLVFFAAPTMIKRLIARSKDCGYHGEGIRTIIYGGGPMYENDIDEALAWFGPRFVQIYGQGESPMTITTLARDLVADTENPRARARRNSVGLAAGCIELAIRDDEGRELPAGETGEITLRGPTVMLGYWQNEKASTETLRDGWLYTGDLGHLDEEGFLYLTDRAKDVIISGGTNIYPREVEEALLRHEAVFEVAVIGVADPEWGENVQAHVVLAPGASITPQQLDSWCRQQIASFKRPKTYVFADELPKNSYGKILKTALRAASQT